MKLPASDSHPSKEEFTVKMVTNVDKTCKLAEVGFEYVTGECADGGKIFRKRKLQK
jgi:hypothetical protein